MAVQMYNEGGSTALCCDTEIWIDAVTVTKYCDQKNGCCLCAFPINLSF